MLLVPLLTGCANINTDITINDDKSAEVTTELTYFGNLKDASDPNAQFIMDNYQTFLDSKYNVITNFNKEKSTINAAKKTVNLNVQDLDLSSLGFSSNLESGKYIEIKKNFLISSYNIDLVYDFDKVNNNIINNRKNEITPKKNELEPEYFQKYADLSENITEDAFQANLDEDTKEFNQKALEEENLTSEKAKNDVYANVNIKLPSFASSNNADSFVGTTYTWEIKKNKPTEIKLQYVRYSGFAILFVLLIGIGLIVYMTRKILRHETQKRMDNIDNIEIGRAHV